MVGIEYQVSARKPNNRCLPGRRRRQNGGSVTKAIILSCQDVDRGIQFRGAAYSKLLDPIGDALAERGLMVRSVPLNHRQRLVGAAAHNHPRRFRWHERVRLVLAGRLKGSLKPLGRRLAVLVWRSILRELNAGKVLAIQPHKAICIAGKELGIEVIDVQHGGINLESRYYRKFSREVDALGLRGAPSRILCWDKISASGANAMLQIECQAIGNPQIALDSPANDSREGLEVLERAKSSSQADLVLLVPDSWSDKNEALARRQEFLTFVAAIADAVPHVLWVVRPHPVQLMGSRPGQDWATVRREYAHHFGDCDNVLATESVGRLSLHELLLASDGVLTEASGVLIEARIVGRPVAILGTPRNVLERSIDHRYLDDVAWLDATVEHVSSWTAGLPRRSAGAIGSSQSEQRRLMQSWLDQVSLELLREQ